MDTSGGSGSGSPSLPSLPLSAEALRHVSLHKEEFEVDGFKLLLVDVKPKGRPDDVAYTKHPVLAEEVPRGCCFVVDNGSVIHALCGLPKFGYHADLRYYGVNDVALEDDGHTLVFTEKANGECMHISAFPMRDGRACWLLGSKNVHVPVLSPEHLEEWAATIPESQKRFTFALSMARRFFEIIPTAAQEQIQRYCLETGRTLTAEHCDPDMEHLVRYDRPGFVFLGINGPHLREQTGVLAVDPLTAFALLSSWGLTCPEAHVVGVNMGRAQAERMFEERENSEGAVVYVLGGGEGGRRTLGIYKHKNHQYILLRAVREQMRNRATPAAFRDRMRRLPMAVGEEDLARMQRFYDWARETQSERWQQMLDAFLTAYHAFLAADDGHSAVTGQAEAKADDALGRPHKLLVILVGLPGAGKTTLGRALVESLTASGSRAAYIDQDQFGPGGCKAYTTALRGLMDPSSDVDVVVAGKCHVTRQQRRLTMDAAAGGGALFDAVVVTLLRGLTAEQHVARIVQRGKQHATLTYDDSDADASAQAVRSVVEGFERSVEVVGEEEREGLRAVIELDVADETEEGRREAVRAHVALIVSRLTQANLAVLTTKLT